MSLSGRGAVSRPRMGWCISPRAQRGGFGWWRMWPNGSRSRLVGLVWRPRMPCFDPLGGGGEELACHALPPCHMAAHMAASQPSISACRSGSQASGGSIFRLEAAFAASAPAALGGSPLRSRLVAALSARSRPSRLAALVLIGGFSVYAVQLNALKL